VSERHATRELLIVSLIVALAHHLSRREKPDLRQIASSNEGVRVTHRRYIYMCIYYISSLGEAREQQRVLLIVSLVVCAPGWWRPKLQVIFRQRATNYRALLQKITCKDNTSHRSFPQCIYRERDCFYYIIEQTYDVGLHSRRHPMEFDAGTRSFASFNAPSS